MESQLSYSALLDKQLSLAFNKLKDLAKIATVTKQKDAVFDFATLESTATPETVSFKAILLEVKKSTRQGVTKQLFFKSASVGDIPLNSVISFEGQTFKAGPYAKSNGYVSLLYLYSEKAS